MDMMKVLVFWASLPKSRLCWIQRHVHATTLHTPEQERLQLHFSALGAAQVSLQGGALVAELDHLFCVCRRAAAAQPWM
eukprot:1144733-Pelagomonas_calceolata.AAC.4